MVITTTRTAATIMLTPIVAIVKILPRKGKKLKISIATIMKAEIRH